jgi:hypothetical protein
MSLASSAQNPKSHSLTRYITPAELQSRSSAPIGYAEAIDALAAEADAQWVEVTGFADWAMQRGEIGQRDRVLALRARLQDEFAEAAADLAFEAMELSRNPGHTRSSEPELWQAYRVLETRRAAFRLEIISLRNDFYKASGVNLRDATTRNVFDFDRAKNP